MNGMLRLAAAAGAAASLAFVVGVAPAAAQSPCSLKGSHTLTKSPKARIYSKKGRYYGCLYSQNVPRRLKVEKDTRDIYGVTLAGQMVAYVADVCPPTGDPSERPCDAVLHVVRLHDGHRLHHDRIRADNLDTKARIVGVFLKSNGSVGFSEEQILFGSEEDNPHIRKSDSTGENVLLDSTDPSPSLGAPDPHSLTRTGNTLNWTHAGTPRSAPLL